MKDERKLKSWALWIIAFHFLIVVFHSIAHEVLSVKATAAQLAFIIPVIIFAPVISSFLLPKFGKTGAWLMTMSLTGSFFFGLYYHFIAKTIDHVGHVANLQPAFWVTVFIVTAILLAVSEVLGAIAGYLILQKHRQFSENYAARTSF
jgi:hypothetical protein